MSEHPPEQPNEEQGVNSYGTDDPAEQARIEQLQGRIRRAATQPREAGTLYRTYYAGIVPYNGVYHQGTHEPLITVEIRLRIQDVLAAHNLAGEKDRKHPHYLKGTVFCSECAPPHLLPQQWQRRHI